MFRSLIILALVSICACISSPGFEGKLRRALQAGADADIALGDVEVEGWRVESMLIGGGATSSRASRRCGLARFQRVDIPINSILLVLQRDCGEVRAIVLSEHVLSSRYLPEEIDAPLICLRRGVLYRLGIVRPQNRREVVDMIPCVIADQAD